MWPQQINTSCNIAGHTKLENLLILVSLPDDKELPAESDSKLTGDNIQVDFQSIIKYKPFQNGVFFYLKPCPNWPINS